MMKKQLNHFKNKRYFFLFYLIPVFFSPLYAQTISVQGKVTASRYPVQNASVTFIDNADTTIKFSTLTDASGFYQTDVITSVESNTGNIPDKFELGQNYPNPFSFSTAIQYQLKKGSDVQVTIYDVLGREVRKFVVGSQTSGSHTIIWDGRNGSGNRVANGIYFYRLQTGDESQTWKMIFNSGGKTLGSVPRLASSQKHHMHKVVGAAIQEATYTVRVGNTETTFPTIISQQVENVQVQNDTTINLEVNYIASTTVNLDSVHQYIRGFGGTNILEWRPDMTTDEVQKAFGTGPGQIGLSILRLRVPYNLTETSLSIQIPTARFAQSLGAIVIASPWTPPPSMKTNNDIVGGELRESSYQGYADHLKTFADFMAYNRAPLYAISVQNEPDADVNYESCSWNGTQLLNFMKNNAASIGTRIIMPESQNFVHALSDPTLNDSVAAASVSIIAGHIFGGGLGPYPLATSKGKEIWMTEHRDEDTTWTANLATGVEISRCMSVGMSAYVYWHIVRFHGPIYEDGNVSKRGYVMSQFARFVRPGYYRVECNISPPSRNVFVTAYRDSSSSKAVIVAVNTGSTPLDIAVRIQNGSMNSFTTYTTTEFKDVVQGAAVNIIDNRFTYNLEASSVTTFVLE